MKTIHFAAGLFTAMLSCVLLPNASFSQVGVYVDYGSNNGETIVINGTKIYYETYGEGVPLLLLHGGLSSIKGFASVIPELSKHFQVFAIDAPGSGRSEQADSVSFPLMADFYSKMIDALKFDSVYVYGYSMGGNSAFHLAANRPEKVKMLVVHSASNHLGGYNEGFAGTPQMTPEDIERDAQWWLVGHLKRTPEPGKWRKFINDLQKLWYPEQFISDEQLQQITATTLIVQGDKDLVRIETARHIHEQIEDSHLAILPNTTHFVLGEEPELMLDILVPFLTRRAKKVFDWEY